MVAHLKLATLVEGGACALSVTADDFNGKVVTSQLAVLRPNSGSETVVSSAARYLCFNVIKSNRSAASTDDRYRGKIRICV